MKQLLAFLSLTFLINSLIAQEAGNINYQGHVWIPDNNIDVEYPVNSDIFISVKGMANIKADSYVAIFNVTQTGKTAEEVNSLINERMNKALESIKAKDSVDVFIDMLSFVPVYEYENEKKIFSKKTYNEIPSGFEISKNIHIKYSNPDLLNEIISLLANSEIYDLVKVDYFSNNLERVKKELREKSKVILDKKLKNYNEILAVNTDTFEKNFIEDYVVKMPVEMYQSYKTYKNSSLNLRKKANVQLADKSITQYYQPVYDKEFDFVVNPVILQPVIQVMYELKLKINRDKLNTQPPIDKEYINIKEYIMITKDGELIKLDM